MLSTGVTKMNSSLSLDKSKSEPQFSLLVNKETTNSNGNVNGDGNHRQGSNEITYMKEFCKLAVPNKCYFTFVMIKFGFLYFLSFL